MAEWIDGKKVSSEIREEVRREVNDLTGDGVRPGLVAVRVGDDPASEVYVRNKRKACEKAGIYSEEHHLPADTPQDRLLQLISGFNKDPKIHGILIQLPLPKQLNTEKVIQSVSPAKDVDGLHAINIGRLTM